MGRMSLWNSLPWPKGAGFVPSLLHVLALAFIGSLCELSGWFSCELIWGKDQMQDLVEGVIGHHAAGTAAEEEEEMLHLYTYCFCLDGGYFSVESAFWSCSS